MPGKIQVAWVEWLQAVGKEAEFNQLCEELKQETRGNLDGAKAMNIKCRMLFTEFIVKFHEAAKLSEELKHNAEEANQSFIQQQGKKRAREKSFEDQVKEQEEKKAKMANQVLAAGRIIPGLCDRLKAMQGQSEEKQNKLFKKSISEFAYIFKPKYKEEGKKDESDEDVAMDDKASETTGIK